MDTTEMLLEHPPKKKIKHLLRKESIPPAAEGTSDPVVIAAARVREAAGITLEAHEVQALIRESEAKGTYPPMEDFDSLRQRQDKEALS